MAKVVSKKVALDNHEKFSVLAICSSEPDARLAWLLNRALRVDFVNERDLLGAEVDGQRRAFAVFEAEDEARELRYTLITIRQESEVLVRAYAKVDFLLALSRALPAKELLTLRARLRAIPGVTAVFDVSADDKLLAGL